MASDNQGPLQTPLSNYQQEDAQLRGRGTVELAIAPVLDLIAEHASYADQQRNVHGEVIRQIKANDIMRFTAADEIGGLNVGILDTAFELEAVAARCASTGWVLWNHLCTFHLFAGVMGPNQADFLREIVANHGWVCFPAGASTGVKGKQDDKRMLLNGKAAFGSGARYADYAGVSFVVDSETPPSFSLVALDQAGVNVDGDWQAMSLRASATDTVYYKDAEVRLNNVVPFPFMYRVAFRDEKRPMIHTRYREDWVALSDMWLGFMAVGVLQACLDEVSFGIRERVAIMGVKVAERPLVQVNLGQAQVNITAARDTLINACLETDMRINAQQIPTEANYLRQLSASVAALQLCAQAMTLLQRVLGGNGLREGPAFERRFRDFQAMPLHINAHQDRVNEQMGRALLGLQTENPF